MPTTILDLIDLRSFSNVWYWIFIGVIWSRVLSAPLGIPVDLIREAKSGQHQAQENLAALAEILLRRHLNAVHGYGAVLTGIWAFALTVLLISSFMYSIEFAQAVLLLALPLALARIVMLRTAKKLAQGHVSMEDLPKSLSVMRWKLQAIALLAVFLSAIWGMYHNLMALIL